MFYIAHKVTPIPIYNYLVKYKIYNSHLYYETLYHEKCYKSNLLKELALSLAGEDTIAILPLSKLPDGEGS